MKRTSAIGYTVVVAALTGICLLSGCRGQRGGVIAEPSVPILGDTVLVDGQAVPLYAYVLRLSYPDYVCGYEDGSLILQDGARMLCDDGKEKDYQQRLDDTDIEDMFRDIYPAGPPTGPAYLADPGRCRCEAFFKKMYGSSAQAVRRHLVPVDWFGQKIMFSSVSGAADSLRAVEAELRTLPRRYARYFENSSSFYWRQVRGADRLSAHSYGIAIDICTKYSDYWLWTNPGAAETDELTYRNRIPARIVEVFERHGFISGAKWYHYDTMHFEFRPDLLLFSRCRGRSGRASDGQGANPAGVEVAVAVPAVDTVFAAMPIPPEVETRMRGVSYPEGATVPLGDLRYLRLSYVDFNGALQTGEMVCNQAIANDLVDIFRQLWLAAYPIRSIRLIDDFGGSDDASMEADNTSCFNYRKAVGLRRLSRHAEGMAVDINPLENPYVRGQSVRPASARLYADREKDFPHKIDCTDLCYKLFREHGFSWGGTWRSARDYQHFEK